MVGNNHIQLRITSPLDVLLQLKELHEATRSCKLPVRISRFLTYCRVTACLPLWTASLNWCHDVIAAAAAAPAVIPLYNDRKLAACSDSWRQVIFDTALIVCRVCVRTSVCPSVRLSVCVCYSLYVRPSHHSAAANHCGGFAAVGPAS